MLICGFFPDLPVLTKSSCLLTNERMIHGPRMMIRHVNSIVFQTGIRCARALHGAVQVKPGSVPNKVRRLSTSSARS
jgi:hypothetical protein